MADIQFFYFGIELELCISPRQQMQASDVREYLAALLRAQQLNAVYYSIRDPRYEDLDRAYEENALQLYEATWIVTEDITVRANGPHQYPVELVSPKLRTDVPWEGQIDLVYAAIGQGFTISLPNDTCSTHIHVTPGRPWRLVELKLIAKAVIHFMNATASLDSIPASRYSGSGTYAYAPRLNGSGGVLAQWIREAQSSRTWNRIFAWIDHPARTQNDIINLISPSDGYAWNFDTLNEPRLGTIEFRLPPASGTNRQAKQWVNFTLSFVMAALNWTFPYIQGEEDDVDDLADFLKWGDFLIDEMRNHRS